MGVGIFDERVFVDLDLAIVGHVFGGRVRGRVFLVSLLCVCGFVFEVRG